MTRLKNKETCIEVLIKHFHAHYLFFFHIEDKSMFSLTTTDKKMKQNVEL